MARPLLRSAHRALSTLLIVVIAGCSASNDSEPRIIERPEWSQFFEDADAAGTFALREVGSGDTTVFDATRAAEQRLPASTFKILNSLIVLQTEVLADPDQIVEWDGVDRGIESWNQDHSLRSGIEVSAVWAFQELARQVGAERMQRWVRDADYGNGDIGGGIDQFWLDGDLRISPLEQLDFLEALVTGDLPFDDDVTAAVADIIVRATGEDWTWSHKTGTALSEDPDLGWLVGSTEHAGRQFVFAMNLDLTPVTDLDGQLDPLVRQSIARDILGSVGALPPVVN